MFSITLTSNHLTDFAKLSLSEMMQDDSCRDRDV